MQFLAIDTSGKALTVIIKKGEKVIKFCDQNCGVRHSVSLMPKVEEMLDSLEIALKDLDFVAVCVGAGSFTGIRIGVSTAKALCFANNLPCLTVTSFDILAYNKNGGRVLAVLDAGHNGFYACGYYDNQVVFPPSYIMKDQLLSLSKEYAVISDGVIDGVESVKGDMVEGFLNAILGKESERSFDYDGIIPLYVRKSQAEEGR